jgi:hypothetical protein
MGRFVIDADTGRARKSVGDTGCRACSVASEYLSAHGVELAGGRARGNGLHHGLPRFGDHTTRTKECIEILLLVNRHAVILRRAMTLSFRREKRMTLGYLAEPVQFPHLPMSIGLLIKSEVECPPFRETRSSSW